MSELASTSSFRAAAVAVAAASSLAVAAWWHATRRSHRTWVPSSTFSLRSKRSWEEVWRHDSQDSAWIVVRQEIYDVTSFLDDHPGGRLLLLAFAGRDATETFESVGHSSFALRELKRMSVGVVARISGSATTTFPKPAALARKATLTGGPMPEVTEQSTEGGSLWKVEKHGFLPSCDPVGLEALYGTPFECFAKLAEMLPALTIGGQLREYLAARPELCDKMRKCCVRSVIDGLSEAELERAFSAVGFAMVAYWRDGVFDNHLSFTFAGESDTLPPHDGGSCAIGDDLRLLPSFISLPMLALSDRLQRPPMIDYASSVLYNWVRLDPSEPVIPSNIRCVLRLTGTEDEEWFFKTHVVIESEASHVISALIRASRVTNNEELLVHLGALEEALWNVVRAGLPIMYERDEDGIARCSEHVFYQVVRPLIKSGLLAFEGDTGAPGVPCPCLGKAELSDSKDAPHPLPPAGAPQPRPLAGPSGAMSSLLPAIDAALGIRMTSQKLADALATFEHSMPKEHRAFLAELRLQPSIRDRIKFSRFGESNDQHEALVRAYNRCISRMLDFRWQHWQFLKNFIMKPSGLSQGIGTGGSTFDYLQQHITDTERARLTERAELSRVPTPPQFSWMVNTPTVQKRVFDYWCVDGTYGLLSREPLPRTLEESSWVNDLPPMLRSALEVVWDLALRIPGLCAADGPFRERCEEASEQLDILKSDHLIFAMPEAAREHCLTIFTHLAAGCNRRRRMLRAPSAIDRPLQAAARSVGRPARLESTELVLNNWRMPKPKDSVVLENGDDSQHGRIVPQVAITFLANPDEDWYRILHIRLHYEAREAIAAIRLGQGAMLINDDSSVGASMTRISVWLNSMCDMTDASFEQRDSRPEAVMMRRLEPFVSQGGGCNLSWEETAVWVYTGCSVLLPAIHAYCGVVFFGGTTDVGSEEDLGEEAGIRDAERHAAVNRLSKALKNLLNEMQVFFPWPHRAFLEELSRKGSSLRHYCFRRFGTKISVEELHNLEVAYNDCLNALVRFLSRRIRLVSRLFPEYASAFSALHNEVEARISRNRLQLLRMRQRVAQSL